MDNDALLSQLDHELILQDISLDETAQHKLIKYLDLLIRWNKTYNLTAIRDPKEMVSRHLIDSLTILPYLEGERFIDVGTGAGLPGMVIAIARPDTSWVLLDSNLKKTRFLTQVVIELDLNNVEVVHSRIEDYQNDQKFDLATSRAVTSLSGLLQQVEHLCPNLLAMKGQIPDDEIKELPEDCEVGVFQVQIKKEEIQRSIITINNQNR
ncbi:MAG: 16S rRNA (guanine(527)-N(7))-methyltransferase RsmG [Gammaproteobacteria bacterium]